jgi:HD-like signal output (HDOD) protein
MLEAVRACGATGVWRYYCEVFAFHAYLGEPTRGHENVTEEAAPVVLTCSCGQKMKAPANAAGKQFKCVRCGEKVVVPGVASPAASAAPVPAAAGPPAAPPPAGGIPPQQPPVAGRIGELLIQQGLINQTQLEEALSMQVKQGGKTFENLIALGHLDKERLHTFLSKQQGVASIDLKNYQINRDMLAMIPREFATMHMLLPIDKMGRLLTVGMACPIDTASIAEVERITGLKVKAMLCRLDDIHAAVKQYYPDEKAKEEQATLATFKLAPAPPKTDEGAGAVAQLESLPLAPATLEALKKKAQSKPNVRDIIELAMRDAGFAADLLALANSPYYGFAGKINTVAAAVALLGAEASCTAGLNAIKGQEKGFDFVAFNEDALFVAHSAQIIATRLGTGKAPSGYAAGLFCRMGRLALWVSSPERAAKIDPALSGPPLARAEKQAFNCTHADAGYSLAKRWGFPPEVAEAIRYYMTPEKAPEAKDLAAAVSLSALLSQARSLDDASRAAVFEKATETLKVLKLDKAGAEKLFVELRGNAKSG